MGLKLRSLAVRARQPVWLKQSNYCWKLDYLPGAEVLVRRSVPGPHSWWIEMFGVKHVTVPRSFSGARAYLKPNVFRNRYEAQDAAVRIAYQTALSTLKALAGMRAWGQKRHKQPQHKQHRRPRRKRLHNFGDPASVSGALGAIYIGIP